MTKIKEIQIRLYNGNYREALLALDEAIKDKKKPLELCLQYMFLKSRLLIRLGRYDDGLAPFWI